MEKELREFNPQEIVEAFQVVGKTFGQLAWMALRFGSEHFDGRTAIAAAPVEAAIFDRAGAAKYLVISEALFDQLRKTEDFGEFELGNRPKFPRDKLDSYIKRKRKGG